MKTRVLTGAGLLAFMVLLFFTKSITPYVFDAFLIFIAIIAGLEMSNILTKIGFFNSKIALIIYPFLSYVLFKICAYFKSSIFLLVVLQVALLILVSATISLICLFAKKRSDNEIKTRKINCSVEQFALFKGVQSFFAMAYPAFIMIFAVFINNIENLKYIFVNVSANTNTTSIFFLVYVFAIPVVVDTFAMLTGSIFKGKKLCEKLSPKKTVSGAIGGLVWGVLFSVALFFIFNSIDTYRVLFIGLNLTWWKVMIAGFISAIMCQLGDLFESYLKRKANIKDSGSILPGHGGVLDRIDSHLANIIVTFIFMIIVLL